MSSPQALLTLNAGSSSVKFKIFAITDELSMLAEGAVTNLHDKPLFKTSMNHVQNEQQLTSSMTQTMAVQYILAWLEKEQKWDIQAVTHRIVHGGTVFTESVQINSGLLTELKKLIPLAPLHQPYNIEAVEFIAKTRPDILQFACFDTAFHANQETLHTAYALPESIREQDVRKFGFHGLSYEWIVRFLKQNDPKLASARIVAAHLGNGSSLCALSQGQSIETTMGMTALAGLPMGTRCGDLDPGVVIYMMRELKCSLTEAETILYEQSGLLGLSSQTNDVQTLTKSNHKAASFALDYYCLKVAQYIAMMTVAIGGIDGIIFTGGIGENSQYVRDQVLARLKCLEPFAVKIVAANEEKMMAIHTLSLLKQSNKRE